MTGSKAARELTSVPVIGPGYISMMVGQELGDQYSIIITTRRNDKH